MLSPGTKKNGFTIIELLMVAAIIGILVSMVAVSVKEASHRSRNTRIATSVIQTRRVAEDLTIQRTDGYLNLCYGGGLNVSGLNTWNETLQVLQNDILQNGGTDINCYSAQESYCVSVRLIGNPARYLCIDGDGANEENLSLNPCTALNHYCK